MLYTTFTVKGKEYKLRLTTRAMIEVEKKLGENPLNIFMNLASDGGSAEIPKVSTLITMLWGAMQPYNHGMSESAVCDLYDEFVDDGHGLLDLVPVMMDVFKVSGFLRSGAGDETTENAEKN